MKKKMQQLGVFFDNLQLHELFNVMNEGIVVIDTVGDIVFANTAYIRFVQRPPEEVIGKHLRDLRPNARLPEVVKSGKAVLHAQRFEEVEEAYFVNMYPLFNQEEIIGGISIITFLDDAHRVRIELNKFEERHKQLLKQINKSSVRYTFDQIIAVAPSSVAVKEYSRMLANGDMTVLLESESGTGKEMYAQSIHDASSRRNGVFLAVNCAGFNKEILDSELFGYADGAFTGAKKGGKMGLFEAANGGTLFLDEIAEMDITLQSKLLRALQERKIRPVGSVKEFDIDVRIICACNANLAQNVERGTFRKDLYYRLNTFTVRIPPLRERREDIPELVKSILEEINRKHRKQYSMSKEALNCLVSYDWPGNVRELRNVVELSTYLSPTDIIPTHVLPEQFHIVTSDSSNDSLSLAMRVKQFERAEIERLLAIYGNTVEGKKKIAGILDISLASLYNKLKE